MRKSIRKTLQKVIWYKKILIILLRIMALIFGTIGSICFIIFSPLLVLSVALSSYAYKLTIIKEDNEAADNE